MTILSSSFCENMWYVALKMKEVKGLCNHSSWKEGVEKKGAEIEAGSELREP